MQWAQTYRRKLPSQTLGAAENYSARNQDFQIFDGKLTAV